MPTILQVQPADLSKILLRTVATTLAVGNNQQIVAGTANIIIRVMGWIAQGSGGISVFQLETGSGGAAISAPLTAPSNASALADRQPIYEAGYMQTNVGDGLYIDVATNPLNLTLFYIQYPP